MKKLQLNPPQQLVSDCCSRCELFPSKPGQESCTQAVIAASNAATKLEKMIQAKTAALVYPVGSISPKLVAAHLGLKDGQSRSENERIKDMKKDQNKKPAKQDPRGYID